MSTPLATAIETERRDMGVADPETDTVERIDPNELVATGNTDLTSREHGPLGDPRTQISFEDTQGHLTSGDAGVPRPIDHFHAKQIGQTPPMQLIKQTIVQEMTGGRAKLVSEEDLAGPMATLAETIETVYGSRHFQEKHLDDLITEAVIDMVDSAFAYWEILPSADGALSVAGFKSIPALQMTHNIDPETDDLLEEPAFYHVPFKAQAGRISVSTSEPTKLDRDEVVMFRAPQSSRSNRIYGESLAVRVREWLELITDVDVHQKRFYADSQVPTGFIHFTGAVGEDKVNDIQQDIREVSGDPHDLVTTTTEGDASWIPIGGGKVADLDAIQQQEWYFKLVLAAAGLNQGEIGIVTESGFAKEMPTMVRQTFKKIAKPYKSALKRPQNEQVLPKFAEDAGAELPLPFEWDLERFDPLQEKVERDETLDVWAQQIGTLNEVREQFGHEAIDAEIEIAGQTFEAGNTPRWLIETAMRAEQPQLSVDGEASFESQPGEFGEQEPMGVEAVGEMWGLTDPHGTKRALDAQAKQLDGTIEVQSSFLVSTAYHRGVNPDAPIMQLEFEREDQSNWVYWYADVEEFRFFNFLRANSKGKYFNKYIRGEYAFARVS